MQVDNELQENVAKEYFEAVEADRKKVRTSSIPPVFRSSTQVRVHQSLSIGRSWYRLDVLCIRRDPFVDAITKGTKV